MSACITAKRWPHPAPMPTAPPPLRLPMLALPRGSQITRLNAICKEYTRKQKAGEPLPPTLEQLWAKGEIKLPFTKA